VARGEPGTLTRWNGASLVELKGTTSATWYSGSSAFFASGSSLSISLGCTVGVSTPVVLSGAGAIISRFTSISGTTATLDSHQYDVISIDSYMSGGLTVTAASPVQGQRIRFCTSGLTGAYGGAASTLVGLPGYSFTVTATPGGVAYTWVEFIYTGAAWLPCAWAH
jgi:hypothetical protein